MSYILGGDEPHPYPTRGSFSVHAYTPTCQVCTSRYLPHASSCCHPPELDLAQTRFKISTSLRSLCLKPWLVARVFAPKSDAPLSNVPHPLCCFIQCLLNSCLRPQTGHYTTSRLTPGRRCISSPATKTSGFRVLELKYAIQAYSFGAAIDRQLLLDRRLPEGQ